MTVAEVGLKACTGVIGRLNVGAFHAALLVASARSLGVGLPPALV